MTLMNGQSEPLSNRCVLPECASKDAGMYGFPTESGLRMHKARMHKGMGPQPGKKRRDDKIKTRGRKVVVQVEDPEPETMTFSSGAITFEVSNNYIPLTAPDGSTWLAFRVIEP